MAKRKIYRVEETTLHHSVYEVEAATEDEALAILKDDFEKYLVEEFWGDVTREIKEKTDG